MRTEETKNTLVTKIYGGKILMKRPTIKLMRLFIGLIRTILILGALLVTACTKEAEPTGPITLIFSTHESNAGLYYARFLKPWIDEVEKRTEGKIKIEAHFNGELAGPPDAWDVLVNGTVDISNVHLQNVPDKFPLTDYTGFTTYGLVNQKPSKTMWELYNKYPELQKELEEVHILFLGSTYWTSYAGSKEVRTLEDMKGLKSVGGGKWQNKRAEKLGMVPVSMGPMDILPSLQTGVVDGRAHV